MEHTFQVWLQNGEDLLKYDWAQPLFDLQLGEEPHKWRTQQGYIHLGEVKVGLPEIDHLTVRTKTVEGLRGLLQKTRADAEVVAKKLEDRINDLLMIGYTGEEDHV